MNERLPEIWKSVLQQLRAEMNNQTFETWFADTKAVNINENVLTLSVQDDVVKKHISDNYQDIISSILLSVTGKPVMCKIVTENDVAQENELSYESEMQYPTDIFDEDAQLLNTNYTFDTFIVGQNNQLANAAAVSISKNPGAQQYNPLFIYGDSGLGKTHLLQAIGNELKKTKPYIKVLYLPCEKFINEFIISIKNSTMPSFKIKYRSVDVLLIDDIQFMKGSGTQEEFFHTFNDLYQNKKQIVITSDRPPKELPLFMDRLVTRFEWGLLADIQPPNLETREAILRNKAELEGIKISDDIINYVALNIKSSIRALEAALKKLHLVSTALNIPITKEMANKHLRPLFEENVNKQITIPDIIEVVSRKYRVSAEDIVSKSRQSSIVMPRFVAMFLSTRLTNITTTEIGKQFGNRDHSTVINARNNIEEKISTDDVLKDLIDELISELKG